MCFSISLKQPHKVGKENLKYNTVEQYKSYRKIIDTHLKSKLECYQVAMITSVTIQEFIYKLLYDFNVPKYEGKEFRNKFNEYISPNK